MQVLHIDTGREMRGGQYQVLSLLNGLREKGCKQVILARKDSPLWLAALAAGHRVLPASAAAVWSWSKRSVIVHAHDARAHTLAALASRRRFVVSRRVAFPIKKTFLSRWKYGRAAAYLAVSAFVAKELRHAGVSPDRVHIVYDGIPPTSPAATWDPSYPIVAIQSTDPGKLSGLVREAAELAGVEIHWSTDLPLSLHRASAFLYLTNSEGLGSGALLAMSMGVPVIASAVGGLTEVFIHSLSGLYVRNDAGEIATTIRTLLSNHGLALRLREGAMARAKDYFSAEKMVAGTLRVYRRVIG